MGRAWRRGPADERGGPGDAGRPDERGGPGDAGRPDERGPASTSASAGKGPVRRLATTLSVLVGVEFVLGIAALFSVAAGRPSGWLPTKGATVYLAHAIVGLPLTLGAVALLVLVRGSDRAVRMAAWIGFIGIAIAGVGGVLAASHPLRLLGMALMFVGPMIAIFAYLIPLLDRTPATAPPYN